MSSCGCGACGHERWGPGAQAPGLGPRRWGRRWDVAEASSSSRAWPVDGGVRAFDKADAPLTEREPGSHGAPEGGADPILDRLDARGDSLGSGEPLPSYEALVPPSGWRAATSCLENIEGSTSECEALDLTRTSDDIWDLDIGEADETVSIDGATAEEEGLILRAWALLRDNMDLVDWAVCWVTGRAGSGDCIANHLDRHMRRVDINVLDGAEGDSAFHADPGATSGGHIDIRRQGAWISRYLPNWASATTVDQECAVVDLACSLLHELTHICMRAYLVLDERSCACFDSYLIEDIFRWALFRRHEFVTMAFSCRVSAGDCQFGYDAGVYLRPPSTSGDSRPDAATFTSPCNRCEG